MSAFQSHNQNMNHTIVKDKEYHFEPSVMNIIMNSQYEYIIELGSIIIEINLMSGNSSVHCIYNSMSRIQDFVQPVEPIFLDKIEILDYTNGCGKIYGYYNNIRQIMFECVISPNITQSIYDWITVENNYNYYNEEDYVIPVMTEEEYDALLPKITTMNYYDNYDDDTNYDNNDDDGDAENFTFVFNCE